MSTRATGINRERQVRRLLEAEDWVVVRAAGSLGNADLVALRDGRARMIEIKTSQRGPFHHFPPGAREAMKLAGSIAGASVELCWWPAGAKRPVWIDAAAWPRAPEVAR